jgi:hypothetical protein
MNLTKMMLVPAFALGLLTVGCGDDCVSACEDGKECSTATPEQKAQDCDKICEDNEKDAETMGCEDEYDDYTSCISDLDDICKFDFTKDCMTEAVAAGACQEKYCSAHADAAECN